MSFCFIALEVHSSAKANRFSRVVSLCYFLLPIFSTLSAIFSTALRSTTFHVQCALCIYVNPKLHNKTFIFLVYLLEIYPIFPLLFLSIIPAPMKIYLRVLSLHPIFPIHLAKRKENETITRLASKRK